MAQINNTLKAIPMQAIYALDLSCAGYKRELVKFKVQILTYAIYALIDAASDARGVYELFAVRRIGDVFKYLWLIPVELPASILGRYQDARNQSQESNNSRLNLWPSDQIPYLIFDDLFFENWDADPEENSWLQMRHGEEIKAIAESCFERFKQAQSALRSSDDLLIQNTINLMDYGHHPYDYKPTIHHTLQGNHSTPHNFNRFSNGYYLKLVEMLSNPEIKSVAYRDGNDYQTLRLCCTEQIRRVVQDGLSVDDFKIAAIGDEPLDADAWGARIYWYSEGLAYGDLFIQQENSYGYPLKRLVEEAGRIRPFLFCYKDEGDISGYEKEAGDGWMLYTLINSESPRMQ